MKIMEGYLYVANANNVRTIFSPSPTHLEVKEEAEIEKKVDLDSEAIAFPIIVFPVPGGPKSKSPLGGALSPVKISGRNKGHTIAS